MDLIEAGIRKIFNKRIKIYVLLFRASRDGFGAENFHSKCDNKRYTVTLVKTKEGRRFGGFTDAVWDQSFYNKRGSNCFIFSIDNNEIYYNKDSNYNIFCNKNSGPTFGNNDFSISNDCNKNNKSREYSNDSFDTYGKEFLWQELIIFMLMIMKYIK